MPAAMRQQGVGDETMALCGQMQIKTPQAFACGAVQMVREPDTGHRWRFDQRSFD